MVFICTVCAVCVFKIIVLYMLHITVHKKVLHFILVPRNEHLWYVSIDTVSVYFLFALSLVHIL